MTSFGCDFQSLFYYYLSYLFFFYFCCIIHALCYFTTLLVATQCDLFMEIFLNLKDCNPL